jgi:dihydroorotase
MSEVSFTIKNATLINEGKSVIGDLRIENGRITEISTQGIQAKSTDTVIDATGLWLMPGVIDDQVHFREPGFTHKADISSESLAALAGGVTTYMEMPNVNPQTTSIEKLEEKMAIGQLRSHVN